MTTEKIKLGDVELVRTRHFEYKNQKLFKPERKGNPESNDQIRINRESDIESVLITYKSYIIDSLLESGDLIDAGTFPIAAPIDGKIISIKLPRANSRSNEEE